MSQFLKTNSAKETYIAVDELGAELAKALGGTVIESKAGLYSECQIAIGEMYVFLHHAYRKNGRWTMNVRSGDRIEARNELHYREMPEFPSINANPTKPFKAMLSDIKRRVVDAAKEPLAKTKDLLAKRRDCKAGVAGQIKRMKQQFPHLDIRTQGDGMSAQVYSGQANGVYFNAEITAGGSFYITRVGTLTEAQATALIKILCDM